MQGAQLTPAALAAMIDHTYLKPFGRSNDIEQTCSEARACGFAVVCVHPAQVETCVRLLQGSPVQVAAAIGFPLGQTTTHVKVTETQEALDHGATEIDMVLNMIDLQNGRFEAVREEIEQVVRVCRTMESKLQRKIVCKVILETCYLTDEQKVQACRLCATAGADFVKTSTGFGPSGATVKDVALMRQTVGQDMGVKASGGIRTLAAVQAMINAGANRIGTSSGVSIMGELADQNNADTTNNNCMQLVGNNYYNWLVVDLRALAVFRILFGIYLMYDVYSRTSLGKYDLGWYTSDLPTSFLDASDTPHKSPWHQIWFTRGSVELQTTLFATTALLAFCFCVGFTPILLVPQMVRVEDDPEKSPVTAALPKIILWALVTAQQNRNMFVHDGSDTYSRHLLFWCCFLPLNRVWSVDTYLFQRCRGKSKPESYRVTGLSITALLVQMALMYWGTVACRTLDMFPPPWSRSEWMPPQLTAVHYAISGSFATRDNLLTKIIRSNPLVSKTMTLKAMIGEAFAPLGCLIAGERWRHYFAAILFFLHLGLFWTVNLPNWQFMGMLSQVVWIPTHVWDLWTITSKGARSRHSTVATNQHKKTEGEKDRSSSQNRLGSSKGYDADDDDDDEDSAITVPTTNKTKTTMTPPTQIVGSNCVSRGLQVFWFAYMLYNFAGERQWILKHDGGDIGESTRLSQYWVMYATVGHTAYHTYWIGTLTSHNQQGEIIHSREVDLFSYIRNGEWVSPDIELETAYHNSSSRYPSPRWERVLHGWAELGGVARNKRTQRFGKALCYMINEDLRETLVNDTSATTLEKIESHVIVWSLLPPGEGTTHYNRREEMAAAINCDVTM